MRPEKRARYKRDQAMAHAREYAVNSRWDMMNAWLEVAARAYPVTEIQLWLLRRIIGSEKFEEFKLGRLSGKQGGLI